MTIEQIAQVCHDANRAYCEALKDYSQPSWDSAAKWQKESAINGVNFLISNPETSPKATHENWLKDKMADGWVYGPAKDAALKTHPCCVPYNELSPSQQAKDRLFQNIVHALLPMCDAPVGDGKTATP